ncbi:MAG: M23 family metallopeptidase [Hyphomicrobium sp.]|uniref:M23 family metallopeptidase n=1 Tax=Hyphomicrobium sp. TaxID=82 RepID=UPI001325CA64|nr:M23 family metallopeptidase [Hyphomicrobium sp.]KAB2941531.1 MAG: M23 family metallopeptidase [Hyphomicrobium sp.]MBZ0210278.1 M23 family metallopeptidase [Hyphomicrobium sp.]
MPQLYRGRAASSFKDLYETDHAETRQGGRFRWLISTCLAGTVGAISILVVIYGSADKRESRGGFLPGLTELGEANLAGRDMPFLRNSEGLKWASPKSDRLNITSGAVTVRYLVNESVKQRRLGREYIHAKPYARIVARLAPVPTDFQEKVPPFNPLKLYATQTVNPGEENESETTEQGNVTVNIIELLGGILPDEDGQELDDAEVAQHVAASKEAEIEAELIRAGAEAEASRSTGEDGMPLGAEGADAAAPNTTVLVKPTQGEEDTLADLEGRETQVVRVGEGDTLRKILSRAGADNWQARGMIEAARNIFPEANLAAGQEVRITLVPSLTRRDRKEPARFSIFSDGHDHLVTVTRNAAGEFVASKSPTIGEEIANAALDDNDRASTSSVYSSVYYAGLLQHVQDDAIMKVMKVHASQTDFRRRLRPGDAVEFFFDMKDDAKADTPPGELLFTSITSGGETYRFYRFRTPDGMVDYYDEKGNNSKQFLMRRPVRGDVRLASGFGMRFHPLLNERRMHTGVDWATSPGTPILAAGTGVIEEAGRKGQYGNYVRIRHPNGYHTAYGHMLRFRKGVVAGAKVRQGEIIGYVGSTGLASGPHLHYEVLINSRFVDPLAIQVPRERELTGRQLAEFQKERQRIDDLRHLAPVMTASK